MKLYCIFSANQSILQEGCHLQVYLLDVVCSCLKETFPPENKPMCIVPIGKSLSVVPSQLGIRSVSV